MIILLDIFRPSVLGSLVHLIAGFLKQTKQLLLGLFALFLFLFDFAFDSGNQVLEHLKNGGFTFLPRTI